MRYLLITLLIAGTAEAQYRDPNRAIYEAMRPLLEGPAYVPPQRIIIEHIAPTYDNYYEPLPPYNPQDLRQAEERLEKALKEVNKLPEFDK